MIARLDCAGVSSRGLVRRINEDGASADGQRLHDDVAFRKNLMGPRHVLLVADGMGGHARGDVASDLALRVLETYSECLHEKSGSLAAIRAANRAVFDQGVSDPTLRGMGSTVVGIALDGATCRWFNVGDSRAYLLRGRTLRQLSEDHVPVRNATTARRATHAVTQSLGGTPVFTEVSPSIGALELEIGDRLLLCSDGLTDVLCDEEIAPQLADRGECGDVINNLLSTCLARGAPDNVTMLVVDLKS